jgi:regulator of sirC expression with transglutaminase-like and TPR domain
VGFLEWRGSAFPLMSPTVLAAVLLGISAFSCRSASPPASGVPSESQELRPERPLPSRREWLDRLLRHPDEEVDLAEAAAVLAAERLRTKRSYFAIPDALKPHVERAKGSLRPDASAEEMIQALNREVLPAISRKGMKDFLWVHEAFGSEAGPCVSNSLLYLLAADSLGLPLEIVCIPQHVYLCHIEGERRRNIETTSRGESLLPKEYQKLLWSFPSPAAFPEDPDALKAFIAPAGRRRFLSILLVASGIPAKSDDEVERDLDDAFRLTPSFHLPVAARAARYGSAKQLEKAEELATRAISLAPFDPMPLALRGLLRKQRQRQKEAIEDYEAALRLAPHGAFYHYSKVALLDQQGRTWEVLDACTKAIENDPGVWLFWMTRAFHLGRQKKYTEAAADLTRAIELNPREADLYAARARTWAMIGDEDKFNADTKKAAEVRSKP